MGLLNTTITLKAIRCCLPTVPVTIGFKFKSSVLSFSLNNHLYAYHVKEIVLFIFCLVEQDWKLRPTCTFVYFLQSISSNHLNNDFVLLSFKNCSFSNFLYQTCFQTWTNNPEHWTKGAVTRVQWWRKVQKTTLYSLELSLCFQKHTKTWPSLFL